MTRATWTGSALDAAFLAQETPNTRAGAAVRGGPTAADSLPVPFLAGDRSLVVAVLSYDGRVAFGLLGCFDAMSDLDIVPGW